MNQHEKGAPIMIEELQQRITENTVLGVVGLRGKPSGYEIRKWIVDTVNRFWEIKEQEIHLLLERLVVRGLVQASSQFAKPAPSRMPSGFSKTDEPAATPSVQAVDWDGQIYSLTPAGHAELDKWLSEPPITEVARNEFLLKVIFAGRGKTEHLIRHIEAFHRSQVENLKLNGMAEQFLRVSSFRKHPDLPYWILVNKYFKHLFNAMKDWSEAALGTLPGSHKTN